MIHNNIIEICPLAFMRGRTFKNCYIIADEMQNCTPNQMKMITTRIGINCKMVVTGDINQSDLKGENGFYDFIKRYDNYCYSGTLTKNALEKTSVAKINVNGADVYLDKDEVIKHIYHSTDGICVGDGDSINLDLKKNGFNSNNGACVTKPSEVSMIDYDIYNDISRESNNFSDAKCDKKHIFSGAIAKFKNERGEFRNKFANMIKTFNELNESEIEIHLSGKFITERGRINCSLREENGFYRWLGIQFVIAEK
jgi:hypothetical protein